jgi:serine O-acetyltransferase
MPGLDDPALAEGVSPADPALLPTQLWPRLEDEARYMAETEPLLAAYLHAAVRRWQGFGPALASVLALRIEDPFVSRDRLADLVEEALRACPAIAASAAVDLAAIGARDPATGARLLTPFLHYKGFHALQWHRVAHWLWGQGRASLAYFLQGRVSQVLAVDIHPAARFGHGVFIDHATGLVVGETAAVGNDVSILQNVTLGGTGKERGDRHPKVRDGVLLGAGAKVLGNVVIGRGAKVGAGSVVLTDVPPCATVVGVPARVVGWCPEAMPALAMDHAIPVGKDGEGI